MRVSVSLLMRALSPSNAMHPYITLAHKREKEGGGERERERKKIGAPEKQSNSNVKDVT